METKIIIVIYHFKINGDETFKGKWESINESKVMVFRPDSNPEYLEIGDNEQIFRLHLIYCKKDFGDDERKTINQQIERIIKKNTQNEILLLLHGDPGQEMWIEDQKKIFETNEKVLGEDFSGGSGSEPVYVKIIDGNKEFLHKGLNIEMLNDLWKILYTGTFADKIVDSLITLHLSLQAFFGISSDRNGNFKKIGYCTSMDNKALNDILININKQRDRENLDDGNLNILDEYKNLFPNPKAFLLVEESGYDFFSTLFEQVLPKDKRLVPGMDPNPTLEPNFYEEEERYKGKMRFFRILELIPKDERLKNYYEKLKKDYNGKEDEKIGTLREICAILANTIEITNGDNKIKYFGYKGRKSSKEYRDNILIELGKQLNIDFTNSSQKHSKVEINGKMDHTYPMLAKQIATWGIKKAITVIELIDELDELLTKKRERE